MDLHPASLLDRVLEATVVGSFSRIGYDVRRQVLPWTPLEDLDLTGRVVLVTGANSGLGLAAAERMARLGASLRLLVRSDDKGRAAREHIVAASGNEDVAYDLADLADFDSVRDFAARLRDREERLDVLVHNAGAMFGDRRTNDAGVEMTVAVHVVGPFLLTAELLPLLEAAGGDRDARVITVSSGGMYTQRLDLGDLESPDDYRPAVAYARAKRAQVVLAHEWSRRLPDRGVAFHTMHPGWADTPGLERSLAGFHKVVGPILRDAEAGVDTVVWLAAAPSLPAGSATFWLDRRPRSEHKLPWTQHDQAAARRLWTWVAQRAGTDPSTPPLPVRPTVTG